jgi:hypothetical protein
VDRDVWSQFKKAHSSYSTGVFRNKRTAKTNSSKDILNLFDPKKYILTHATIIASVDTEDVPGVKLGENMWEDGRKITRLWSDYRIKKDTERYINFNNDAWERQNLLQTFWTFIGGYNYQEHIQDPELSKGIILDAVSRDLGDTVYIDILVATDRSHVALVHDIVMKKMKTMSMGCSIKFSICTKCGNIAADEKDMCSHIRSMKGDTFSDANGVERKIAELCGHREVPESVTFFEGSWVEVPAFEGAEVRAVLYTPEDLDLNAAVHTAHIIRFPSQVPSFSDWTQAFITSREASFRDRVSFSFDDDDDEDGDGDVKDDKNYYETVLEEAKDLVQNKLKTDLKREVMDSLRKDDEKTEAPLTMAEDMNDTVIESRRLAHIIKGIKTASCTKAEIFLAALNLLGNTRTASSSRLPMEARILGMYAVAKYKNANTSFSKKFHGLLTLTKHASNVSKFLKLAEIHAKRTLTPSERAYLSDAYVKLKEF